MAQEAFPLHFLVWNNQYLELDRELQKKEQDVGRLDPRGRTPLELAVCLGHLESTRVLLRHSSDPTHCNAQGWTSEPSQIPGVITQTGSRRCDRGCLCSVLQEAVSTGDPELVQLVLQYRDFKRATERLAGIPELLSKLRQARDFYVEMKWEFTSWVPLVSKVCPSDVYRVWKSGSCLRVDTTLLGFEHMTWLKGRRSYIFKGEDDGAVVMEVDHEKQVVYTEPLVLSPRDAPSLLAAMQPSQENTAQRLTSPIVSTHLNTRNISFERNKSGIWGWRSEKTEVVSGYEAKVYSATNVELVTRSRTEHLSDQDKLKSKGSRTPLQSFLGIAEQHTTHNGVRASAAHTHTHTHTHTRTHAHTLACGAFFHRPLPAVLLCLRQSNVSQCASPHNPTAITAEEYFDPEFQLNGRDIGRPVELTSKVQKFKATLWLSESHPLSLAEQVTPIIDLMAISNAHFAKLRDFITLRLPPGFPVKIEIPLFHVLNARVTFSNLCGCDEPVASVTVHRLEGSDKAGDLVFSACGGEKKEIFQLLDSFFFPHRSLTPALPLRGGPLGVRAPRGLHHPGAGPQRAHEGRGRQPAAVRHPAEPPGRRHRERPGDHLGGPDQQSSGAPESAVRGRFPAGEGHPGVSVHLAGRQRAGGRGGPQPAPLRLPPGELQELPAVLQRRDGVAAVGTLRRGVQLRRAAAHRHGAVLSGAGGAGQVRTGIERPGQPPRVSFGDSGLGSAGSRRLKRRSWRGSCSCRSPKSNATPPPGCCARRKAVLLIYSLSFHFFFSFFF
ncbi:unnamed protein product [Tetraodon nigroviridis]|uniref:(spotted green pufferfish) hypothetical protein n=1 Tax=Tetraodon nigroviridis TaxID=99883 RepID=Q4S3J0_TETNG|nr:unnamed protein product [Tetraodon nigroviridis]